MAENGKKTRHPGGGPTGDRSEYLETVGMAVEGIERWATPAAGDIVVVGLGVRLAGDALVTVKAVVAREGRVVAFVGGATLAGALLKAEWLLKTGTIDWRADKFDPKFDRSKETG